MSDADIVNAISKRGVREVLHFTTNSGLVGILHARFLLANSLLREDQRLAHILSINSIDRSRDEDWLGYINLSVSRINSSFFRFSRGWEKHEHAYWCILGFDPSILVHSGVYFVTTNNAYELAERDVGLPGFEAMFSEYIRRKPGWSARRAQGELASLTTCQQAEVLYPERLSLDYLRAIYVESDAVGDEVFAQISLLAPHLLDQAPIVVDSRKFN